MSENFTKGPVGDVDFVSMYHDDISCDDKNAEHHGGTESATELNGIKRELSEGLLDKVASRVLGRMTSYSDRGRVQPISRVEFELVYLQAIKDERSIDEQNIDYRAAKDLATQAFESSFSGVTPELPFDAVIFTLQDMKTPLPFKGDWGDTAAAFGFDTGLVYSDLGYMRRSNARNAQVSGIDEEIIGKYLMARTLLHEFIHENVSEMQRNGDDILERSGFEIILNKPDNITIRNLGLNESVTDYLAYKAILAEDKGLARAMSGESAQMRYRFVAQREKVVGERQLKRLYFSNDVNGLRNIVDSGKNNKGRFEKVVELIDKSFRVAAYQADLNKSNQLALEAIALMKG